MAWWTSLQLRAVSMRQKLTNASIATSAASILIGRLFIERLRFIIAFSVYRSEKRIGNNIASGGGPIWMSSLDAQVHPPGFQPLRPGRSGQFQGKKSTAVRQEAIRYMLPATDR